VRVDSRRGRTRRRPGMKSGELLARPGFVNKTKHTRKKSATRLSPSTATVRPTSAASNTDNPGDATFNLMMNHELGATAGIVRAHGSKGAFVSRFTINKSSLQVLSGRDHLTSPNNLNLWNGSAYFTGTTACERFCSADLAKETAYFANGKGTQNRIYLNAEETSPPFSADDGRIFAHILSGPDKDKSFQLPRLGRMSVENVLANPFPQDKTVVMINDDASVDTNITVARVCRTAGQTGCASPPSELYMYVGTKQTTGNDIERAGLTNGTPLRRAGQGEQHDRHGRERGFRVQRNGARGHLGPLRPG